MNICRDCVSSLSLPLFFSLSLFFSRHGIFDEFHYVVYRHYLMLMLLIDFSVFRIANLFIREDFKGIIYRI